MTKYFEDLRIDYANESLHKNTLDQNPIIQTKKWLEYAIDKKVMMPNAVSLATTNNHEVSVRTVLIKDITDRGFIFFTDYNSKKAQQINTCENVGILFNWLELDRQIKISGNAEKISLNESKDYFYTRPKESQVTAYISKQSSSITSRAELQKLYTNALKEFSTKDVPLPHWGGYLIVPTIIEFWQGNKGRLHDNIKYQKQGSNWIIQRLYP